MKTRRFSFLIISVLAVVLVAALVFAACDPKHRDQDAEKYTVTFDLGEATGGGISPPEPKTVEKGQSVELPSATWEGHVLLGWSDGEQQYDAGASYTPQKDVKLTAVWGGDAITGSGTDEDPFMINTATALTTFAYNVNHPDVEATKDWYKSSFKLGADIDMTGVKYTPAGSRAAKIGTDEGGNDVTEVLGFQGSFDGNGHTISNLTLEQNVRGEEYIGLFGYTLQAYIHDLKLTYVTIRAISGANSPDISAYIGAVAGYLGITQIDRVEAELNVKMQWLSSNTAAIGGIAGMFHSDGGFIAYAENIKSKLDVEIEEFETGSSVSVLDTSYIGGMFGEVYIGTGAAAIVNVSSESNIGGGHVLGGLIGAVAGDNLSVINAYAKSTLKPSANVSGEERCYAGGIIGISSGDDIIIDSYADVTVEPKINATTAGGIAAYGEEDDFEGTQTYGLAVVNSYYKLSSGNLTPDKTFGAEATADFGKEFATSTLKWNEQSWNFDGAVPSPTATRARDINGGQYALTFKDGSSTTTKTYGKGDKNIDTIGILEEATNTDNNVFWDWQFAEGVDYRYYVPMVKDMTLTAKRFDTSEILAIYEGHSDYNNTYVGIIELMPKGEVDYINSSSGTSSKGNFWYDGEHIIIETLDDDYMCGTLKKNADEKYELQWSKAEGTGSYVTYTFVQAEGFVLVGEFFSDNGDIITFTGKSNVTVNLDGFESPITATFTQNGNTITIAGLEGKFTSATIDNISSQGFTTHFVGKEGIESNNLTYKKMGAVDYSAQPFIGDNYVPYLTTDYSGEYVYANMYKFTFNADGSMIYHTSYSAINGRYYMFGTKMRLILESLVSTFELVQVGEQKVLIGVFNRGGTARCSTAITTYDNGKLRCYSLGVDRNNTVFVNDKGQFHVKNGKLQDSAISGTFANGEQVTIAGTKYIVSENQYNGNPSNVLLPIGPEYGEYKYQNKTFKLDGVNGATGDITGTYVLNGNNVVIINFETGEFVVFDYTSKAADGTVTSAANDGYRGIYFAPNKVDADDDEEPDPKYYALVFDGLGKSAYYYNPYNEGYRILLGGDDWSTYTIRDNGDVYVRYSEYQQPVFSFYYNNQLAYANEQTNSNSITVGTIYTVLGYKGSTEIPKFDSALIGAYSGQGVALTINSDLSGELNGTEFKTARVEANNVISFTAASVKYTFDATDPENITINGGSYNKVKLEKAQEEGPAFPQGIWKGTIKAVSGSNWGLDGADMTITFASDGSVTVKAGNYEYAGNYTYNNNTLTCDNFSEGDTRFYEPKFTVKSNTEMHLDFTIDDTYPDITGDFETDLTKQEETAEVGPFPQGTWSAVAKTEGNWADQLENTMTFTLKPNGTFEITVWTITCSGKYQYDESASTITVSDTKCAYDVEKFEIEITENNELHVSLEFYDSDDTMNTWRFEATLQQQ